MSGIDPHPPIEELDHLLTYVRDGAAAELFFRGLGFTLSPISHITPMGIVNRLILFADTVPGSANFIELMSVADAAKLPPPMAALLRGDDGIKSLVLSTSDVAAAHAHFTSLSHPFAPPVRVEREWDLGDGTSVFPKFDVLLPLNAGLTFNACQYHNVDLYKRPEWTAHANTVTGLAIVFAVAPDPHEIASTMARTLCCPIETAGPARRLRRGRVAFDIFAVTDWESRCGRPFVGDRSRPQYVGYGLVASDPSTVRRFADASDTRYSVDGSCLRISPDIAPGTWIEISARSR
jgi:hypothetical protein